MFEGLYRFDCRLYWHLARRKIVRCETFTLLGILLLRCMSYRTFSGCDGDGIPSLYISLSLYIISND